MENLAWICTLVGIVGVLFSIIQAASVKKAPAGNERMNEIADAIKAGAIAYLNYVCARIWHLCLFGIYFRSGSFVYGGLYRNASFCYC